MRVLLIANKDWEVDPLVGVLRHPKARPKNLPAPEYPNDGSKARIIIRAGAAIIEIWCISDLMSREKDPSSTAEKVRVLAEVFTGSTPALVIAFGTGSYPDSTSFNGCVSLGTKTFIHNAHPNGENPKSIWDDPRCGKLLESSLKDSLFREIDTTIRIEAESRFIYPPLNPSRRAMMFSSYENVALGVANVTNYNEYYRVDHEALKAYSSSGAKDPIASVETTHGIIRMQSKASFLFVTGIANRLGYFNQEAAPRKYAQDLAAVHNAAVAAAWIMPSLVSSLRNTVDA